MITSGRIWVTCVLLMAGAACRARETAAPPPPDAALVGATNTGVGLMGRYDFDAAVTAFTALAASHPQSSETSFNLAIALVNRQRAADAAEAERRLAALTGDARVGTRARYALALLRLYQGRDAEAFPLLTAVAAAQPRDAFPAYFAGQARLAHDPAEALRWFDTAASLDPRLRSAHYGAFQALQRLGRADDAAARLAAFQALETDPRAVLAEFKYTRMGPLAEAMVVDAPTPVAPTPAGPRFAAATTLVAFTPAPARTGAASITVADIDGDGTLDLFAAAVRPAPTPNLVLLHAAGGWRADDASPLARVTDVRAALWGDLDNDGRLDVVLVRGAGRTALWRQVAPQRWQDVTGASRAATPRVDAVDGALVDADHDGDLDLWLVNAHGPTALLNNNGDGTFRDIAGEAGVAGDSRPGVGIAITDLDGDRDHDVVVLKASPPHEVWLNDRVWTYRAASGFDDFRAAPADAVLAADLDGNGRPELYTTGPAGLARWRVDGDTPIRDALLPPVDGAGRPSLALADTNGDGRFELVVSRGDGWAVVDAPEAGASAIVHTEPTAATAWTIAALDPAHGPSVVAVTSSGLSAWMPGPGRATYLALGTTGRSQISDQRRSNVSGIGTRVHVRTDARWSAFDTAALQSGRGQSLQPTTVGLGGAARADLVSLLWSDGVLQSELALDAGRVHLIEETQRQLSSCPVLFAHDGTAMRFVTDILGVGGIGFFERPGVYSPAFPNESVLLPEKALAPSNGRLQLVVGEPMEEVAYFDRFELVAWDLPPGWQVALDERKAIASAPPTGAPVFYREERLPLRATNDRGDDVTGAITTVDRHAAPPGAPDARFIGMTAKHGLTLEFDRALDDGPGAPVLVLDGWVEYPYAQTVFAAWQANAPYAAPTLEARDRAGRWRTIAPEFGYPAGMPRRMTLPLPSLPAGTTALRLSTTQEIYWDRVAVAYGESAPQAVSHPLPLTAATLRASGFAARTTGPQRTPFYDYDHRAPLWDTRHPRGWYTRFGDVATLLAAADDATVVLGPGEEVLVEFDAPAAPPPRGWTRRYVLKARGWCKDMDLYTQDGDTVTPLPGTPSPARDALHARFNTRYEGGR
ncbi:MAG: CRTAC1 family protein [Vicinamibacterales bacterium]